MSPKLSSVIETAVKEAMQIVVDLSMNGHPEDNIGTNKVDSRHWQKRWPDFPQRDGFALADWFQP
jgi:hypothetical protein